MNRESRRISRNRALLWRVGLLVVVLLAVVGFVGLQRAMAVTPGLYEVAGNPSCADLYQATVLSGPTDHTDLADLGPLFGFKYDANPTGDASSTLATDSPWTLTNGSPADLNNSVSISNVALSGGEGVQFDWSATLGIDAVIVKAQDSNAYVYSPEAFGSTGLMAPDGKAVSHVEFCYDYELDAEKTANAEYTAEYTWTIIKDDDGTYDKFIGVPATTHDYLVSVDQTVFESDFAVSGEIYVQNAAPYAMTFAVSDFVDGVEATVVCPTYDLAANDGALGGTDEVTCKYSASLGSKTDGTNTATVTSPTTYEITSPGGGTAQVPTGGDTASVAYFFGDPTNVVGFPEINVSDSNGESWTASGDASWTYSRDFTCPTDKALYVDGVYSFSHENTATIDETGQSDEATVTVRCYAPLPSKDAHTSYTRTYTWDITKGEDGEYWKFIGEPAWNHDYGIFVDQTIEETLFKVAGTITVQNPNPQAGMTVWLSDSVGDTAATLDCGGTLEVPAGSSATCDYYAFLGSKTDGTNTATVTLNDIGFSTTTDYAFGEPTTVEGHSTVSVTDTFPYPDGTPEALGSASADYTFDNSQMFACSPNPDDYIDGSYTYTKTNRAVITETGDYDEATVTVHCYAPVPSKNANTSYTRTYTWDVTKGEDGEYRKFIGDSATTHGYEVSVDQTIVESAFAVSGAITVKNYNPESAMTVSLSDYVDSVEASLICGGSLTVPAATNAGPGEASCGYSAALPTKMDGTNTATVTLNSIEFGATAGYAFGEADVKFIGYPTISVIDTSGESWTASDDDNWTYSRDFSCPTNTSLYVNGVYSFTHPNTATITETGQSDDATVTVHCYAPVLNKDAYATYDERHDWSVVKTVTDPVGPFYPGDEPSWTWTIGIEETVEDQNFAVSGTIDVTNPADAPDDMTVNVRDILDDGTEASVTCAGNISSVTVPPGETATCSYNASPDDASATLNTATATFNNIDFTASASVIFKANVINDDATVSDTAIGLIDHEAQGGDQFIDGGSDICSSNWADYDSTTGKYIVTLSNTATLVDEEGTEYESIASTTYTCEAGTVDLLKLTDGQVNPSMDWQFALYLGPNGFGGAQVGSTGSTLDDTDGILDFDEPALRPDETYTICELGAPAGWSAFWQVDVDGDGSYDQTITPYNPNAADDPPEDIGNRCVDFGADTALPVTVGTTLHFQVDNISSGGAPRTPGYWKNWNRCSGGKQGEIADAKGGWEEGFWLLEDVLDPTVGGGIVWDDILTPQDPEASDRFDEFGFFRIGICEVAVDILDKREVGEPTELKDGKKAASDPLHNLATHLLAAQLNFGAGACTTPEVLDAALQAETLLDTYNFDGDMHSPLGKKDLDADWAHELADLLDRYNNGEFCGGGHD